MARTASEARRIKKVKTTQQKIKVRKPREHSWEELIYNILAAAAQLLNMELDFSEEEVNDPRQPMTEPARV